MEDLIDDWELLPPLHSYETSIDKHGDTITVDESPEMRNAARTLLTPRDTPELAPETTQEVVPNPQLPSQLSPSVSDFTPRAPELGDSSHVPESIPESIPDSYCNNIIKIKGTL